MNTASLLWSVLFGAIGSGYFLYGKKQRAGIPLVCGLVLMVFPYFIANTVALVAVGIGLAAIPWVFRE